jgi:phosphoribosylglycinamide formyltransferase-1
VKPLRLVVLLSGGGRTLLNLLHEKELGRLDAEFPLVISSRRDAAGVQRARDAGLEVEVIRPRDFPDHAAFAAHQAARIAEVPHDLVIMAGYLVFFPPPPELQGRMINIHPALLPAYGGKGMYGDRVHAAVLAAGETESGCTVHVVDDQYDHGPTIAQTRVPVRPDDTVDTLAGRVFEAECATYPEAILRYAQGLAERGEG